MNRKRIVFSREPDSKADLNCNTIKEITGGSELNARVIYSKDTKVNLELTFILECNEKPKLNEINDALRRRVIDVLFGQKFVDQQEYDDEIANKTPEEIEIIKKKIGIVDSVYKQKKFKDMNKCMMFNILAEYYKKFSDNKRQLKLPVDITVRQWLENTPSLESRDLLALLLGIIIVCKDLMRFIAI